VQRPATQELPDLKRVRRPAEIVGRADEMSAGAVIAESDAAGLRAVAEFPEAGSADAPVLTLFETQVIDEVGDCSSRHFAWTKAEALSATARRAQELTSGGFRHPSEVHSDGVDMHAIAFTKRGILKFLNEGFGDAY
jgi:hypothetical protein